MEEFCKALPKIELHAHLNGSVRSATILDLLDKRPIEGSELLRSKLVKCEEFTLKDVFTAFDLIHKLTTDHSVIARITKEMILDCAQDNVKYLELRTTPRVTDTMTKISYAKTVLSAIQETTKELDIEVGLILSINRTESEEQALQTANLVIEYKDKGVVGLDISGNPTAGDIENLRSSIELVKSHNIPITIHTAEIINYEETMKILEMKPDRIGHGIFFNEIHLEKLKQRPIPLELCISSNVKLRSVPSVEAHHFKYFYDTDYPISLCTDDSGIFSTTLSEEFLLAATTFNLKKQDICQLSMKSIDYIFGSDVQKTKLREKFSNLMSEIVNTSALK